MELTDEILNKTFSKEEIKEIIRVCESREGDSFESIARFLNYRLKRIVNPGIIKGIYVNSVLKL